MEKSLAVEEAVEEASFKEFEEIFESGIEVQRASKV